MNILLNNNFVQRGLISHEKWEDRNMVSKPKDEATVGTEHLRSEEWRAEAGLLVPG